MLGAVGAFQPHPFRRSDSVLNGLVLDWRAGSPWSCHQGLLMSARGFVEILRSILQRQHPCTLRPPPPLAGLYRNPLNPMGGGGSTHPPILVGGSYPPPPPPTPLPVFLGAPVYGIKFLPWRRRSRRNLWGGGGRCHGGWQGVDLPGTPPLGHNWTVPRECSIRALSNSLVLLKRWRAPRGHWVSPDTSSRSVWPRTPEVDRDRDRERGRDQAAFEARAGLLLSPAGKPPWHNPPPPSGSA